MSGQADGQTPENSHSEVALERLGLHSSLENSSALRDDNIDTINNQSLAHDGRPMKLVIDYSEDNSFQYLSIEKEAAGDSKDSGANTSKQNGNSAQHPSPVMSNPSINNEGDGEAEDKVIIVAPKNSRKVWPSLLTIMACFMTSFIMCSPITVQYLNYRIGRDQYNFSMNGGGRGPSSQCSANASHKGPTIMDSIEQQASRVMVMSSIITGIPATIVCLVVGSYSDFLGRRPLLLAALIGNTIRTIALAVVVYFDIAIQFLYVGAFAEGLFGSMFTMFLATNAAIADITPEVASRASKFAILEGVLLISGALSQVAVGFLIRTWGYFAPSAVTVIISFIGLLVAAIFMPETNLPSDREPFDWNPKKHLRKVFGFYYLETFGTKRVLYGVALFVFFLLDMTNGGRNAVEMLFVLNAPICWTSVNIGVYQSLRMVVWSIVAVLVLRLTRYRLPLESVGIICGISAVSSFFIESLATSGVTMYLAACVGILFATIFPVPRALASQITESTEQGALFSGLAFVQAAASMFANLISTVIYNQTISTFKGAVFLFLAALCALATALLGFHWFWRKRYLQPPKTNDLAVTNIPESNINQDVETEADRQQRNLAQGRDVANDDLPLIV